MNGWPGDAPLLLDTLGDWMDQASLGHHLPNPHLPAGPGQGAAGDPHDAHSALYLRALRARLASLGYLSAEEAQPNRGDQGSPALTAAVLRFQRQAGFTLDELDGWAGPRTQQRLQQLVAFEEEQDLDAWGPLASTPLAFPAVQRALYLRLATLGLFGGPAPIGPDTRCTLDENPTFQAAFQAAVDKATALGLCPPGTPAVLNRHTLGLVFEHDRLVGALAQHPAFVDAPEHRRFVDAVGRVELWLAGYGVPLEDTPPVRRRVFRGPRDTLGTWQVHDPVGQALADFAHRFPPPPAQTNAQAAPQTTTTGRLTRGRTRGGRSDGDRGADTTEASAPRFNAHFFAQVHALASQSEDDDDTPATPTGGPAVASLQDQLLQRVAEHRDSIAAKLGQLASRLWDGVKRAWAWLKAALRGAWQAVEDELWNLARVVARGARDAYAVVLRALDLVHRGVVALRRRTGAHSQPHSAVLGLHTDFDARLFLHAAPSDPDTLPRLLQADHRDAQHLRGACQVLGLLLGALGQVVKVMGAGAALGWLSLLLALTRVLRSLRELRSAVMAVHLGADSVYANPVV